MTSIPTGQERGQYLAVDLGGTNCRICSVELHGDSTYRLSQEKYAIPRELMVNSSHEPLFDYVAEKIQAFIAVAEEADSQRNTSLMHRQKLGFTFSFTYESHSLCRGTMLQWDKGWDIPDALGKDPCQMLQNAIDRLSLPVVVVALTNDSVGTLMASAYTAGRTAVPLIGAIFGTGTNAAYVERLSNIKRLHDNDSWVPNSSTDVMVVNTEWGAFFDDDSLHLPTTEYDDVLDKASVNPGDQLFEKRVSGMYLGELARLAIMSLVAAQELDMLVCKSSPLMESYAITSEFLTLMAKAGENADDTIVGAIETVLGVTDLSVRDIKSIGCISSAIVQRSARLSAAAMAAIIEQSGELKRAYSWTHYLQNTFRLLWQKVSNSLHVLSGILCLKACHTGNTDRDAMPLADDSVGIGIDGSLYELYPYYDQYIRGGLRDIKTIGVEGERKVQMHLVKDGSSLGAALVAQSTG